MPAIQVDTPGPALPADLGVAGPAAANTDDVHRRADGRGGRRGDDDNRKGDRISKSRIILAMAQILTGSEPA
ncbi:MAG: hypothetical protein ACRD0W_09540 [Acidimicrobiales bacterium]